MSIISKYMYYTKACTNADKLVKAAQGAEPERVKELRAEALKRADALCEGHFYGNPGCVCLVYRNVADKLKELVDA